jgi:hypothetical protein
MYGTRWMKCQQEFAKISYKMPANVCFTTICKSSDLWKNLAASVLRETSTCRVFAIVGYRDRGDIYKPTGIL